MNKMHAEKAVTLEEIAPFLLTFTCKEINLKHTARLKFWHDNQVIVFFFLLLMLFKKVLSLIPWCFQNMQKDALHRSDKTLITSKKKEKRNKTHENQQTFNTLWFWQTSNGWQDIYWTKAIIYNCTALLTTKSISSLFLPSQQGCKTWLNTTDPPKCWYNFCVA